jgi:hypothetical protein
MCVLLFTRVLVIFKFCCNICFQAELELLLMSDNTEKNHFSFKSIQQQEEEEEGKKKKSHKRKLKKKLIKQESKEDSFEVI